MGSTFGLAFSISHFILFFILICLGICNIKGATVGLRTSDSSIKALSLPHA
jgi:hypothetical protein